MSKRAVSAAGSIDRSVTGDGNRVELRLGDGGIVLPLVRRHQSAPNRRRVHPGDPPRATHVTRAAVAVK
jgi:hypothetical protein